MENILSQIVQSFEPGDLIPHSYLRELLDIRELKIEEYATTQEFLIEFNSQQFSYMTLIDKLRDDLLFNERYYLKNIRGDGYTLMLPKEQVAFAYEQGMNSIKKAIKDAKAIMTNIRYEDIPAEQLAKDNDLLVKMSGLAQIFTNKRK